MNTQILNLPMATKAIADMVATAPKHRTTIEQHSMPILYLKTYICELLLSIRFQCGF